MTSKRTAAQEWKAHWPLVISAMIGLSFTSVLSLSLGLFMEPLEREFGWTRTQMSLGMTVYSLLMIPLSPFGGAFVDRFGARKVAIPGIALSGLAVAAFSLISGQYWQWLAAWIMFSFAGALIRQTLWNRAISTTFDAGRGMALAILLCGIAIAQALTPSLSRWLIDAVDWRQAYVWLGVGWGGLALLLLIPFFHEGDTGNGPGQAPAAASQLTGFTLAQALRNRAVMSIMAAIALQCVIGGAANIHIVPMLVSAGVGRLEAAGLAGLIGIGSFAGKLLSGWMVNHMKGGALPFAAFAMPGLGYLLVWQGHGSPLLLASGVFAFGFGGGVAMHVTAFLMTHYAGLANFGKIFGVMAGLMSLGSAIGPLLAGIAFDATGSYALVLIAGIPAALLAGLLVAFLGPYPDFSREAKPA